MWDVTNCFAARRLLKLFSFVFLVFACDAKNGENDSGVASDALAEGSFKSDCVSSLNQPVSSLRLVQNGDVTQNDDHVGGILVGREVIAELSLDLKTEGFTDEQIGFIAAIADQSLNGASGSFVIDDNPVKVVMGPVIKGAMFALNDPCSALSDGSERSKASGKVMRSVTGSVSGKTSGMKSEQVAALVGDMTNSAVSSFNQAGLNGELASSALSSVTSATVGALTDAGISREDVAKVAQSVASKAVAAISAVDVTPDQIASLAGSVAASAISGLATAGLSAAQILQSNAISEIVSGAASALATAGVKAEDVSASIGGIAGAAISAFASAGIDSPELKKSALAEVIGGALESSKISGSSSGADLAATMNAVAKQAVASLPDAGFSADEITSATSAIIQSGMAMILELGVVDAATAISLAAELVQGAMAATAQLQADGAITEEQSATAGANAMTDALAAMKNLQDAGVVKGSGEIADFAASISASVTDGFTSGGASAEMLASVQSGVSDVVAASDSIPAAGISVSATSGSTSEAGAQFTFTVVLLSPPTANVRIPITSSNTTEGSVSPFSITFTSENWNAPQTITAVGVNDFLIDGSVSYAIVLAAASSSNPRYEGMNGADVTMSNTDNDSAGYTVTAVSGATSESGMSATFTVVLNSQPTANVTTALSSSDLTEGTVSPASLVFTSTNWQAPQIVTVTGADDVVADGNQSFQIATGAANSPDTNYNALNPSDVTINNTDNDTAGFTFGTVSGPSTEAGGTATFTVVLNSEPSSNVVLGISSNDTTEGTVAPGSLTFTTANWNAPQTITVTGVNDQVADGNQNFSITTAAATSTDAGYSGMNPSDVAMSNTDNDTAGFTISAISGATTEAGGTATFTVVLNSEPTADVVVGVSSTDSTEGTVAPASLTFTAGNWSAAQTVTVTGVNDAVADGNINYVVALAAATSTDSGYNGLNPNDVTVSNTDNDSAGITIGAISGTTSEAGGTATFTIVLNSEPTSSVTIGLSSGNTAEGTVSPSSVTFNTANWATSQTITVTGVDDVASDGNQSYSIITAAATSADVGYSGVNAADVSVTNVDNEIATDSSYASVTLLAHFDGANNSTTFTDQKGKSPTTIGSPKISTAQSKFGGSSLLVDNGSAVVFPHATDFDFGAGDFTVEGWIYPVEVDAQFNAVFVSADPADAQGIWFGPEGTKLTLLGGVSGGWDVSIKSADNAFSINAWQHFALSRNGNTFRTFVNGAQVATGTNSSALTNSNNRMLVGGRPGGSQYFNGYIDDVRITKGVGRYTANFSVPTEAYPNQ
jgi:hypothetical protein